MKWSTFSGVWLALAILFFLSEPAEAEPFEDLNQAYWSKASILRLHEKNLLDVDGKQFQPLNPMTRAEYITMVVKIMDFKGSDGQQSAFQDVHPEDWFYPHVQTAVQHQLIKGKEGNRFDPHSFLTREEMIVIASRLKKLSTGHSKEAKLVSEVPFKDRNEISPWAYTSIEAAYKHQMISGYPDGMLYPHKQALRAEAASLLDRLAFGDPPPLREKVILVNGKAYSYVKQETFQATAYGPHVGSRTATGKRVRFGMIAVDPKVIPLGTKLFIKGYSSAFLPREGFIAVAEDTGGAVKGKKIDIFINQSRKHLLQFGVQKVQVYVLKE